MACPSQIRPNKIDALQYILDMIKFLDVRRKMNADKTGEII